jgi:hypothetical protein
LAETAQKNVEKGFRTLVVVLEKLLDVLCQNKHYRSMGKSSHYRQLTALGVSKKGDMKQVP